jgi:hypothetical protein
MDGTIIPLSGGSGTPGTPSPTYVNVYVGGEKIETTAVRVTRDDYWRTKIGKR